MKNMTKILIGIGLLFFALGVCSAVTLQEYKLPNGYSLDSDTVASNGDYGFSINEYNTKDYDFYFTNTSDSIVYTANNITNYTSDIGVGCDEIVDIDGEDYLIEFYCTDNDLSKISDCYSDLLEFNRLNGLEPIAV